MCFGLVWLRMRAGCVFLFGLFANEGWLCVWFGLAANEGLVVCFDG